MTDGSPGHEAVLPRSPLSGSRDGVSVVRPIDIAQLIDGYRRCHNIDIAPLFAGVGGLRLLHDGVTGLSFFDPPVCGDAAFYGRIAQRPGYHRADKAEFRIAARHVRTGARVLEVGAGVGHFVTHLAGADYTGLEFNALAVAEAQSLGRAVHARALGDVLRDGGSRFDVTCAFQVLEHVADPREMIGAMVELTCPGGQVILATPNAGAYISRCRDLLNAPPHHVTWWEDRTWLWVAQAFGLDDVKLFHTPIDDMLGAWAQMVAANGIARQLGIVLDPVVDETPLRHRIDRLAEPVARTILAGLTNREDVPEAGHTTVAVFRKPEFPAGGGQHAVS